MLRPRSTLAIHAGLVAFIISAILLLNHISQGDYKYIFTKGGDVSNGRMEAYDINKLTVARLNQGLKVDLVEYFKFIPNGLSECTKLYAGTPKKLPKVVQDAVDKHAEFLKKKKLAITEGYSLNYIEEAMLYVKLVQLPFVNTVCETGFNGGHSTLVWLSANPKTKVYSFDLGYHPYGLPVADYLNKTYPGRLAVNWGNSKQTIPKFIEENPSVKCDLMIIDGGHTTDVCASDFENFKKLASPLNMILLDNYPDNRNGFMQKLGDCWEPRKKKGEIAEIMRCGFGHNEGKQGHGFSFGRLII